MKAVLLDAEMLSRLLDHLLHLQCDHVGDVCDIEDTPCQITDDSLCESCQLAADIEWLRCAVPVDVRS